MWERYTKRMQEHLRKWTKRNTSYIGSPTDSTSLEKIEVRWSQTKMELSRHTWRIRIQGMAWKAKRAVGKWKCIYWSKQCNKKKCPKWQHKILDQLISLTWQDQVHYQQASLKSQCTMGIFCSYTSSLNNQPVMNRIEVGNSFAAEVTQDL